MIGTIITLLTHDLAVALRNKTLVLVICVPLFVYATLTVVDSTDAKVSVVRLALVQAESYPPEVLQGLAMAPDLFAVTWVPNEETAAQLLREQELDGVLTRAEGSDSGMTLTVVQQASVKTLAILQQLTALQSAVEGNGTDWVDSVRSLQTSSVKRQTLPTWVLMMVLLVSFIVLPTQVAEEKEKQLLLGWMQTPVREREWLVAKLAYGVVLILASVVTLQLMGGDTYCKHGLSYLAMLCAGGFCFGAMGICLGLLCRNQAAARTFGVLCYLPLLMPVALSDMSQKMRSIAPLVPSYHLHEPIRAMILDDAGMGSFSRQVFILVAMGLLACLASHHLLKKRWLM